MNPVQTGEPKLDPFGRPQLATPTSQTVVPKLRSIGGSVWPSRRGSERAFLDT